MILRYHPPVLDGWTDVIFRYVEYSVEGIIEKNRNTLNADLLKVIMESSLEIIPALFGAGKTQTQKVTNPQPARLHD